MNFIFYLMLSFVSVSYCNQELTKINQSTCYSGYKKYSKEYLDFVQVNGTVLLDGTKVSGPVEVNGALNAFHTEINSLKVNGTVEMHNSVIKNNVIVSGSLTAVNTRFLKNLTVASQKVVLRMCKVESLTIKEVEGYTGKQIIDLRNGTNVTGQIVVESGKGEIWISSNSIIAEEQVSGAKVYKK